MKIALTDKEVQHALDLSSEELVSLLRYRRPTETAAKFKVVSPLLLVVGSKKYQVDLLEIELDRNSSTGQMSWEGEDWDTTDLPSTNVSKKKKDKSLKLPSLVITTELTAEIFTSLLEVSEVMVLLRINNVPGYFITDMVRVDYNKAAAFPERDSQKSPRPRLIMKSGVVRPIVDLLKAQISESSFYECFIGGKSEEFYNSEGDALDEIVELIGFLRKNNETDIALRRRVIDYLKLYLESRTSVTDEDLNKIVDEAQKKIEIDKKIDEASGNKPDE